MGAWDATEEHIRWQSSTGGGKAIVGAVIQPCDAGVIGFTKASAPCPIPSRRWVIAATGIGSGMAFLDSTVVNVTLPAVQANLGVTLQDVQWVYGAYALVLTALLLEPERELRLLR